VLTRNALEIYSRETQCLRLPGLGISYVPEIARRIVRNTQLSVHIKLRGLSPHANYTDRAAAAGRRS